MSDSLLPFRLQPARLLCPWKFSRQEYWSGWPCLSPGDLPIPGIEPRSPTLQTDSLPSEPPGKPIKGGGGLIPQSCPTLWDPMDSSLQGSSVHEILQERILESVAISSSRGSSPPRDWIPVSISPAFTDRFFTSSTTWEGPVSIYLWTSPKS